MSTDNKQANETPGNMLAEARESMGLSLADVAAMTRIPKTMLKHLESDRYEEYSAEVFARGHLRNYAREVQIDPDLVLQAFDRYNGNLERTPEIEETSDDAEEDLPEPVEAFDAEDWLGIDFERVREQVQPVHLVAVGLVLFALFVVFGVLTGQRATAQKNNEFPKNSGAAADEWKGDEKSEKSRWLLEKSAQDSNSTP